MEIEHVGSTSVPGLAAKPVLDILVGVPEFRQLVALGKMATMETISVDGGSAKSTDVSRAYFKAFADVEDDLKRAWDRNAASGYNHPGWDLSPLGYVAKSIRDREFFSSGSVPGDCIVDAIIVDQHGRRADGRSTASEGPS